LYKVRSLSECGADGLFTEKYARPQIQCRQGIRIVRSGRRANAYNVETQAGSCHFFHISECLVNAPTIFEVLALRIIWIDAGRELEAPVRCECASVGYRKGDIRALRIEIACNAAATDNEDT
jgi:hypothetical protein